MSKRQRTEDDSQPIKFTPVQTLLFSLGPGATLTEAQMQIVRDALAEHDKKGNLDTWTVRNLRAVMNCGNSSPLYWEFTPAGSP